jgi:tetratricopeptide (TPR) repeat protein
VAKYKKKRARELQQDRFRDTALTVFDRLGNRLEGKGKAILYGLIGLVVVSALVGFYITWNNRKKDEARRALGRAIAITSTPVSPMAPSIDPNAPKFTSERERAEKAIEEFQKVTAKYGDPYRTEARYFIATNLLYVDREKGISELTELSKSSIVEVALLSKFALAQAKEADAKDDEAAQLYSELAAVNSTIVTSETANLRLAAVYEKQGKKKEAVDLLFNVAEASRKARDVDGAPLPPSAAGREAAEKLQKLDPERYAKLTPEAPATLPFGLG